jgi:hypothetical protein
MIVRLALGPGGFTRIFGRMTIFAQPRYLFIFNRQAKTFIKPTSAYLPGDEDTVPI